MVQPTLSEAHRRDVQSMWNKVNTATDVQLVDLARSFGKDRRLPKYTEDVVLPLTHTLTRSELQAYILYMVEMSVVGADRATWKLWDAFDEATEDNEGVEDVDGSDASDEPNEDNEGDGDDEDNEDPAVSDASDEPSEVNWEKD